MSGKKGVQHSVRVTMQAIAERAGVHKMTVSLALRGHSSIPESTQLRIRALAESMGYRPDPMLSALAAYRRRERPGLYTGTLAWVDNDTYPGEWRTKAHAVEFYHGANDQAELLGYSLESFSLYNLSTKRLRQVMKARNIRGMLLAPQPQSHTCIEMDWSDFSVVTFGYTLASPVFHRVNADHYGNVVHVMEKLIQLGYRRIGLAHSSPRDERLHYLVSAAFERYRRVAKLPAIPVFSKSRLLESELTSWYRRHTPEVIITSFPEMKSCLVSIGVEVPRQVGIVLLSPLSDDSEYTGLSESPRVIGAAAVKELAGMCIRGDTGIPAHPHQLVIQGQWIEGETLRNTY